MIAELKRILLAEDNAYDVELTMTALRENNVVNEIVVVRDGAEALDYLFKRDRYADRPGGNPALVLLDLKMPKVDGVEVLRQVKRDEGLRFHPRGRADVVSGGTGFGADVRSRRECVRRQASRLS